MRSLASAAGVDGEIPLMNLLMFLQEHLRGGGSSEESPRSDPASEEPGRDGPGGGRTSAASL